MIRITGRAKLKGRLKLFNIAGWQVLSVNWDSVDVTWDVWS